MTLLSEVRVDSADFTAWVRPHLPVMGRVAARLAPDADRDDVVQDALTRAWRKQGQYDESRGSASAWLCAIVAGEARRARARRRPLDVAVPASSYDLVRDLDLERAVATLPKRQREAVDLHYFVGLSVAETAAVMGCAEGTVKSTLSDARGRLRDLLGEDA